MIDNNTFDDIRPFTDDEMQDALTRLSREPVFLRLISFLFPTIPTKDYLIKLRQIKTVREFQQTIISPYLEAITQETSLALIGEGFDKLSPKENYFYISNHRDIILDSALLNILLAKKGFDTTEIAIGDNLLIQNWITDLVRINKNFIVHRNIPVRQMLEAAKKLSAYVRYAITEKHQSVWMAQREGRSKDSDDRTQDSVLKMLNISNSSEDIIDTLKLLQVTPVSISYEYDPCDFLKAREFLQKKLNPEYKKTPEEDMLNMKTGLKGYKGHISFVIAKPISDKLEQFRNIENKADKVAQISALIDEEIHKNYTLYSGNYVAYDLLHDTDRFSDRYTPTEKQRFIDYIENQLQKIQEVQEHREFLKNALFLMYANPLINFLKTQK